MERIVEAWSEGEFVERYLINLSHLDVPPTDDDFVAQAKQDMLRDGLSPALIDDWKVCLP